MVHRNGQIGLGLVVPAVVCLGWRDSRGSVDQG